jgi:hypothetical protein
MVFNPTFNNISAKSWRSVLLVGGNRRKPPYDHDHDVKRHHHMRELNFKIKQ